MRYMEEGTLKTVLTNDKPVAYNGTEPVRCECGKVLAFQSSKHRYKICDVEEGTILLKCHRCKRIIAIRAESF